MNSTVDGSYWTGQPRCVQTAENATNLLPVGWTTQAGLPSAGLVKERACPTGTEDATATAIPRGPAEADAAAGLGGLVVVIRVPPAIRPMMAVRLPSRSPRMPTATAVAPRRTTVRRCSSSLGPAGNVSWMGKTGHPASRV